MIGHAKLFGSHSTGGRAHTPNRRVDSIFLALISLCTLIASLLIVLIALFLFKESFPLIQKIGVFRFLTDDGWWPTSGEFNLAPMIATSLLLMFSAVLIATPIAVIFAIYMSFYAGPRIHRYLRVLVDVSAAVPTILFAFWGLVKVVPLIAEFAGQGTSLLAGALVLALMIFPTITILTNSALSAVPNHYFVAGSALGIKRFSLIWHVAIPQARGGIIAAVILGAARAIGETMVVLVLCGNIVQMPTSIFDPVRTLTANIALEMPYAMGDHRASLYVSGMIVLLVVSALVLASELYAKRKYA